MPSESNIGVYAMLGFSIIVVVGLSLYFMWPNHRVKLVKTYNHASIAAKKANNDIAANLLTTTGADLNGDEIRAFVSAYSVDKVDDKLLYWKLKTSREDAMLAWRAYVGAKALQKHDGTEAEAVTDAYNRYLTKKKEVLLLYTQIMREKEKDNPPKKENEKDNPPKKTDFQTFANSPHLLDSSSIGRTVVQILVWPNKIALKAWIDLHTFLGIGKCGHTPPDARKIMKSLENKELRYGLLDLLEAIVTSLIVNLPYHFVLRTLTAVEVLVATAGATASVAILPLIVPGFVAMVKEDVSLACIGVEILGAISGFTSTLTHRHTYGDLLGTAVRNGDSIETMIKTLCTNVVAALTAEVISDVMLNDLSKDWNKIKQFFTVFKIEEKLSPLVAQIVEIVDKVT